MAQVLSSALQPGTSQQLVNTWTLPSSPREGRCGVGALPALPAESKTRASAFPPEVLPCCVAAQQGRRCCESEMGTDLSTAPGFCVTNRK